MVRIGTKDSWFVVITRLADTRPDSFSFTTQTGVAPNTVVTSNEVTVAGVEAPSPVRANFCRFVSSSGVRSTTGATCTLVKNGTDVTGSSTTVVNGDKVKIKVTSNSAFSGRAQVNVTIGTGFAWFTVATRAQDTMPDSFSFTAQTGAEPGASVTSNEVTVAGVEGSVTVRFSSCRFLSLSGVRSTTGAACTLVKRPAASGSSATDVGSSTTVVNGDKIAVKVKANGQNLRKAQVNVTIGTGYAWFTVTTRAQDTMPDSFSFTAKTGVEPGTSVTSNEVTVAGVDGSVTARSVFCRFVAPDGVTRSTTGAACTLVKNGTDVTGSSTTVVNGDKIAVKVKANGQNLGKAQVKVTIGTGSAWFTVTTRAVDTTPDAFSFTDPAAAEPGVVVTSNEVTVAGVEGSATARLSLCQFVAPDGVARTTSTGCTLVKNGMDVTGLSTTVANGDRVAVKVEANGDFGGAAEVNVHVGTGSVLFTARTRPPGVTLTRGGGRPLGPGFSIAKGGRAIYGVALEAAPASSATVTISVSSVRRGDKPVTVGPSSLTFTNLNWNTPRNVGVWATAETDGYAGTAVATLGHEVTGLVGDSTRARMDVTVTVFGDTRIRAPAAGTVASYLIGLPVRWPVTVETLTGVPPGIELDFPAMLSGSIALTIAPAPDNLPPSGAGFAVVDGTAVDISVADMASVPPGGVEVCLPATAAREGQDLTLLHYASGAWAPVAGSAWDATRMLVCAGGVTSFSPFALGDRSIEFVDRSIEFAGSNQVYTVDKAIKPLVLPLVKEGTAVPPITYALTPAVPPGLSLSFDEATWTLSGTPTEVFSATEYSWTARDADGSEKTLTFTIAVAIDTPTLSIDSPRVTEGTGTRGGILRFLVSLSAASGNQVTVDYADAGTGTATSADYTAIPPGTLTFAAGTTSQPIAVTVTGDATDEADETVVVRLSGPVNATLADASEGTGTIVDDDAALRVRLKAINESVLPELSRALWGSALDAVTGRLESPDAAAPTVADGLETAAGFARANESALEEGDVSWKELLGGESFAFGLAGDGEGGPGAGGVVAWGSGDWRRLSRDEDALDWSGDAFSAHLGADAALRPDLRAGLAASWFSSDVDYTDRDRSGDAAVKGSHESRMTSLTPYLGWDAGDGARLWGAAGYGWGEIEIVDEVRAQFGAQKADSWFLAGAAGGSVPVWSQGPATLEAKGSAEATRWRVKDNGAAIAGVTAETQRLRLAAEGSRGYALPDGTSLTPTLEAGVRWDGGDGATGMGLEAGGGLSWTDPARSLTVEAKGRALLVHNSDVEEWGASGSMRLAPDADGLGLSFRLLPSWGASGSGVARLWDEGVAAARPADGGGDEARLETELGYGLPAFGGAGVTTPYAGFGLAQGGERDMRAGVRLGLGAGFDLGVEAERNAADAGHGIGLDLRIRW